MAAAPWIARCYGQGMRGFSLLEVLVATTLVAVGVTALAQLVALATYANLHARHTTMASILAQQKMEELLSRAGADVPPSPADALGRNAEGYCDFVDRAGRVLGDGPTPPGAAYLRRWWIAPLPGRHGRSSIVQVLVQDLRGAAANGVAAGVRLSGQARLVGAGHAF